MLRKFGSRYSKARGGFQSSAILGSVGSPQDAHLRRRDCAEDSLRIESGSKGWHDNIRVKKQCSSNPARAQIRATHGSGHKS